MVGLERESIVMFRDYKCFLTSEDSSAFRPSSRTGFDEMRLFNET